MGNGAPQATLTELISTDRECDQLERWVRGRKTAQNLALRTQINKTIPRAWTCMSSVTTTYTPPTSIPRSRLGSESITLPHAFHPST